jgi:hypothetical protein
LNKSSHHVLRLRRWGAYFLNEHQVECGASQIFRLKAELHAALLIHRCERKNGGETNLAAARSWSPELAV